MASKRFGTIVRSSRGKLTLVWEKAVAVPHPTLEGAFTMDGVSESTLTLTGIPSNVNGALSGIPGSILVNVSGGKVLADAAQFVQGQDYDGTGHGCVGYLERKASIPATNGTDKPATAKPVKATASA